MLITLSIFGGLVAAASAGGPQTVADDTTEATDTAPTPAPAPPEVADVAELRAKVAAAQAKMDAFEHYLADQLAAKEGKAPKGWVQPDLSEYEKPGAPATFIPQPASAAK